MIIVAAMISTSCIYYLPVQQEALGHYHKEPDQLLLLQGEEENQMVNLTHTSSFLSLHPSTSMINQQAVHSPPL